MKTILIIVGIILCINLYYTIKLNDKLDKSELNIYVNVEDNKNGKNNKIDKNDKKVIDGLNFKYTPVFYKYY